MFRKQPSWLAGAFIEMVVVVVSILIAFSLDAWWDRQMEQRQEREVMAGLLSEFREVEAQIEEERRFHAAVKETTLLLMELSLSDDLPVQADSLDRLLGDLFWWGGESNYSSGTLTSAIASGQMTILALLFCQTWGRCPDPSPETHKTPLQARVTCHLLCYAGGN